MIQCIAVVVVGNVLMCFITHYPRRSRFCSFAGLSCGQIGIELSPLVHIGLT